MLNLTDADLSNLITACNTSSMRGKSDKWAVELDRLAEELRKEREQRFTAADYEQAAITAGWTYQPNCWVRGKTTADPGYGVAPNVMACATAKDACQIDGLLGV